MSLFGLLFGIFVGTTGFVIKRFRETKILTPPQLYEMRYSKGVRIIAGFICFVSGVINMGVFPVITGRFFTYFVELPEKFSMFGVQLPTIPILTGTLIATAIIFAFMGGQITVILTDFIQAAMINFMFIIIGIMVYRAVTWDSIYTAFLSAEKTDLYLNPFSKHGEFGLKYIISFSYLLIFVTEYLHV